MRIEQWKRNLLDRLLLYAGGSCVNERGCCGSHPEIETLPNGDIFLYDFHGDSTGFVRFKGYCSLPCMLLDIWHALGEDCETTSVGDQIRALKKGTETIAA